MLIQQDLGEIEDQPIPEDFRCPTQGGPLHPSHTDCQIFYTCSPDGMALRNKCERGLFFNYQYMFCGKEEDVVCYSVRIRLDKTKKL